MLVREVLSLLLSSPCMKLHREVSSRLPTMLQSFHQLPESNSQLSKTDTATQNFTSVDSCFNMKGLKARDGNVIFLKRKKPQDLVILKSRGTADTVPRFRLKYKFALHSKTLTMTHKLLVRSHSLIPRNRYYEIRTSRAVTLVSMMCCGLEVELHFILSFATSCSKSLTSVKRKAVFPLVLMLTPLLAGSALSTPVTYRNKDI